MSASEPLESFLPSMNDRVEMPNLDELFDKIDEVIEKYAEDHLSPDYDDQKLNRLIAGHVCREQLKEFQGTFRTLSKRSRKTSDWDVCMSMARKEAKRQKIGKDTNQRAREISALLKKNGDEIEEEEEEERNVLKSLFDVTKDELEKKRLEKASVAGRKMDYNKDLKKLKGDLMYMKSNYGANMMLATANQHKKNQIQYPPSTLANSDVAYDEIREIEMDIGSKLHYGMLNRPTVKKQQYDVKELKGKEPKVLLKLFRDLAREKNFDATGNKTLAWKEAFKNGKIHNWPGGEAYNVKVEQGDDFSIELKKLKKEPLIVAITMLDEDKIYFSN